jgi:hypothetical protein
MERRKIMKCGKHDYGYDDLPVEGLKYPDNDCPMCWAVFALNQASGEFASYNVDLLEEIFADFRKLLIGQPD